MNEVKLTIGFTSSSFPLPVDGLGGIGGFVLSSLHMDIRVIMIKSNQARVNKARAPATFPVTNDSLI